MYGKIIPLFENMCGGVAQWLEQMIHNHRVEGSSPSAATRFFNYKQAMRASVAQSVERRIRNAQVEGSSPSAGSKNKKGKTQGWTPWGVLIFLQFECIIFSKKRKFYVTRRKRC